MSRPATASVSRLFSTTRATFASPVLALPTRPRPELSHTFAHFQRSHTRQTPLPSAFQFVTRSLSSTPASCARLCLESELPGKIESSQTRSRQAWWRLFNRTSRDQAKKDRDAARARKHAECDAKLEALKLQLHRYLLPLYRIRLRLRKNRHRSPSWRPARLCFRTPTLSNVFKRRKRCGEEAERRLKLCRRFPLAFFDERRRHQPQRAAHFRYAVKLVRSEVALHFSQGSQAWKRDLHNHHRLCPKRKFMEKVEAELFAQGGGGGGSARARSEPHHSSRQHQYRGRRTGEESFDYSTFRRAYWYSKTHSSSRPYNHHREWTRRANRIQWTRPQEWVLRRSGIARRRTGVAFFTMRESPSAREVQGLEGRGGNGGIHKYRSKTKTLDAHFSSRLRTPSTLRPPTRPRLSPPNPAPPSLFSRTFTSSRPHSGIHFLVPLATALKSTEALHVLVWVTRLSLTLLPLSVRAKAIFALRERYLKDPSSLTATIFSRLASTYYSSSIAQPSGFLSRFNAWFGLPLLLLSPFLLLGLVGFASLERTPVTGRWRLVMLSPKEEEELVDGILSVGRTVHSATTSHVHSGESQAVAPEGTSLDWVAILRQVLNLADEGVDPETGRRMLLGGVVLDQRDWRVRWTEAVLRALEKGVVEGLTRDGAVAKGDGQALRPPPPKYLLEGRMAAGGGGAGWKDELIMAKHLEGKTPDLRVPLQVEYDILVIDRDENNAFSFGFAPETESIQEKGRRGVIVVYTGFLKEVLGETALPSHAPAAIPSTSNPNRLATFFSRPSNAAQALPQPDPIASYMVPSKLPTQDQCRSLAVLLSHETAHLILSHTLESYASMNLLMPHLSRLASDVLRTLLYPVTAILGPFINDAVGRSLSEGAKGGFGIFGNAANSCESRKLESEADLVALRLLAGSGIDPRYALDFWENRLSSHQAESPPTSPSTALPFSQVNAVHHHSKNGTSPGEASPTGLLDGYMRTHPVDEERLARIRQELKDWEAWNRSLQAQVENA
ncbi:hypothetical protein JCM11491_000013 [Sporobolomyces phaffii]